MQKSKNLPNLAIQKLSLLKSSTYFEKSVEFKCKFAELI